MVTDPARAEALDKALELTKSAPRSADDVLQIAERFYAFMTGKPES